MQFYPEKFRFVALWLCFVCIVAFILQFIPGFTDLFVLNNYSWIQVYRFISSIFLHGSLAHLFFNLFALGLFGSMLERVIGWKRFLIVFFSTGILANLISVNFYDSSLGASGAIFGVIGALIILAPTLPVFAFGMPLPLFIAGIFWVIADLVGVIGFATGTPLDNTGNIAHLSGMFFGFLFGVYQRLFFKIKNEDKLIVKFDEDLVRNWEDFHLKN